ncbi:Uncharacterized protein Fot_35965 [Forsythia ovata]|uniref:Uncharacterized protein n=1 Tax=Forsythia ovata TaxID=205694 RepID=A0ABD1SR18_9LAMI
MAVLSFVLIEEPEVEVLDMKLTEKSSETALWNTNKIIRDRDHFKEQVTWLQGSISVIKKEVKILTEDGEKLKADLVSFEADAAEFSKKYDHANHAQELTAKALAEVNSQREGLVEKTAQLEDSLDSAKAGCSSLKEKNLELEWSTEEVAKVGV